MIKTMIIIRGLPGAGKSTLATTLLTNGLSGMSFEADNYFYDDKGQYRFDASLLEYAHSNCYQSVENAMKMGIGTVIISNTFVKESEVNKYLDLAANYGYYAHSLVVENRHGNSSIHNVPKRTFNNMFKRFKVKLYGSGSRPI